MNNVIFTYLYSLSTNNFMGDMAVVLHQLTYPILGLIIIISLIIALRKLFAFSLLILSGSLSWFIAGILKFLFHTPRPFMELDITPLIYQSGFAFPSQHTAVFSAIAISMFLINKKFAIIILILAIIIGVSRIILGVHYPIDILGGLLVGIITSFVITYFFKKI